MRVKKAKKQKVEYYLWRSIRDEILRRDNFICYRCDKQFIFKKELSVHHLVPRSEGGKDCYNNLITLCNPCHDYVEMNGLRTKAEIMGSYEGRIHFKKIVPDTHIESEIDKRRPDWHKFVYGGCKR